MSTFARRCRSAILLFSAAIAAAHAQQTLRVPQDFPTVQTAINAASSGDTVLVSPGTYPENLTVDTKPITLRSTAGAATTILDGQQLGPVLKVTGVSGLLTTIDGFTFQNGVVPPPPSISPVLTGGGLYVVNSGLTVSNSVFRSIIGPSVLASHSTLRLSNSIVTTTDGSPCTNAGVGQHSGVTLTGDSVITTNGAPVPSMLFGNTISGDGTFCAGGAIELEGITVPTVIQNNILHNNLGGVGAISAPFHLVQNLIYDNGLGAVSIEGPRSSNPSTGPATTTLINNTMVNNHTSQDTLNGPFVTEINILNAAAQVALSNNILVGTTQYALLSCQSESQYTTTNDTPLLLDHNDLFNTTSGLILSGTCFPNLASPLSANGNLSVDPRLSSSTDLHPLATSPVIDAGLNLADDPLTDLDDNPRLADASGKGYPVVDLGAFERPAPTSPTLASALQLQPATFVLSPGTLTLTATAVALSPAGNTPLANGTVTLLLNGSPTASLATLHSNGSATLSISLTTPGVYALTAALAPSLGHAPATSPIVYVLVTTTATTTLSIAATPTTQITNQPVTLTVHLGSTTSGSATQPGPIPPGAVTLSEASTILSSLQPDASGLATFTVSKPTTGTHTYTVTYAGTTTYSAATASTAVAITAPTPTSIAASITPIAAPLRQTVTLAATVSAATGTATPTGAVNFTDGGTLLGSIPLSAGTATLSTSTLSAGLHTITIAYSPDPAFSPSSTTRTVTIGGDTTATTLNSANSPALTTDTVTYTVTVTRTSTTAGTAAPAGSVSLSEGNTLLASAPLIAGPSSSSTASLPALLSSPGTHILTATYIPATAATFPSSGTLTQTITAPPPITLLLTTTPDTATLGQTVTLSAAATSPSPLPSPAIITFLDGASPLATVPLPANGVATLPVSSLTIGTHPLTAVLRVANSTMARSTSTVVSVRINGLATTLTLTASPSPTAFATALITLSAILSPAVPLPSGATLGGTVTFFDGTLPLGIAPLSPDGQATLSTSALVAGPHTLSASFSGNTVLAPATSADLTEVINANPTTTQLLAPSQSTAFAPITLAAHITASTTSTRILTPVCTPACTPVAVTFFADTSTGRTTLGTVPVDPNGGATLTLTPAAGTYSLSAVFLGTPLFATSTSALDTLLVSPAITALTVSANPNPAYQHGAVTLSAVLTAPGIPAADLIGTVAFLEGATTLGSPSLAAAQSFPYPSPSVGTHTITAIFSGAPSLIGSSATVIITVLASDFILAVKDTTLTIPTTHHASTTIAINTTGSLADLIDISCANLPQSAHCTFSPATHDLTATNTSAGTLTLDTDALLNYAGSRTPSTGPGSQTLTTLLAFAIPSTLLAGLSRLRRHRRNSSDTRTTLPHLLAAFLLSVATITVSGCSGIIPPHVPPGTYPVTITGHARSAGIEHSTTLTLIVTP